MTEGISLQELQLAARNHGIPLEALRWDVTPIGLHYLLTHYDIPDVDAAAWRLDVGGLVERPQSLSLDDLRSRPSVEVAVTMECAGNGRVHIEPHVVSQPWLLEAVGTARWRGVAVAALLEEAGMQDGAVEVLFTGLDRGVEGGEEQAYERSLPVDEVMAGNAFLAYEVNGVPLPPQHGFPLRLVVPGWYGMTSVKWLSRITLVDEPFDGLSDAPLVSRPSRRGRAGRADHDDRATVADDAARGSRVRDPRARGRGGAPARSRGRAWSGRAEITGVDVSSDGGETWSAAELGPATLGRWAWRSWRFAWSAEPGEYELCCRARDAAGNEQPLEPAWNVGGYVNNAVQRVSVSVTE